MNILSYSGYFHNQSIEVKQEKKKNEITIRSSAAEYLTYVASVGGEESSVEMRYEDENIWLTQKMMTTLDSPEYFYPLRKYSLRG